jgi:hypothetical protein
MGTKQTSVYMSQHAANHSPRNFVDPETFAPEPRLGDLLYAEDKRSVVNAFPSGQGIASGKSMTFDEAPFNSLLLTTLQPRLFRNASDTSKPPLEFQQHSLCKCQRLVRTMQGLRSVGKTTDSGYSHGCDAEPTISVEIKDRRSNQGLPCLKKR